MILSDRDLRAQLESRRLVVEPLDPEAMQPSSIDLRVGHQFRVFANSRYPYIDVRQPLDQLTELVEASEDEPFILHPGEFVLGSTLETVTLPDDLVARLEGKSSLGRLGLLIHSSLPGDETVLFLHEGELRQRRIDEIVTKELPGLVVSFDPETFECNYQEVTGWYEGPPDRIFEVVLASGRRVHLTAGHDLFTLDHNGELTHVPIHLLGPGVRVAIPRSIPDPPEATAPTLNLIALAPESAYPGLVCGGPSIARAWRAGGTDLVQALRDVGISHTGFYRTKNQLPLGLALQNPVLVASLGPDDWLAVKGGRHRLPAIVDIDAEVAWLLGLYVAEGSRRRNYVVWSNTSPEVLDRVCAALTRIGIRTVHRSEGAITASSALLSEVIRWIGASGYAREKRIPPPVLTWPRELLGAFLEGFTDGDGSREETRISLWTSSDGLARDLLVLCQRLSLRASGSVRDRPTGSHLWQISVPHREHKLLTAVPIFERLLIRLREELGLTQREAAARAGFSATHLNNIERHRTAALRLKTLRRLQGAYALAPSAGKLDRAVDGGLAWDEVREVRDTGRVEPVYDLEVRPDGRKIENFVAGSGVFVSNTAGFVDAGWSGQLTLELSNVANLPITIYPGMRIGQLCVFQLSSPAEKPYGSQEIGSKYHGQTGPTPSRYFRNFKDESK